MAFYLLYTCLTLCFCLVNWDKFNLLSLLSPIVNTKLISLQRNRRSVKNDSKLKREVFVQDSLCLRYS